MKTTSFPRLFANAALLAALAAPAVSLRAQAPTQSYLRNTPSEIEREDPRVQSIIARADEHFKLGELNLKDNKRQAAREEFDKAVDAVLESGMDVRSNPRLQHYYLVLVENVREVFREALKEKAAQTPAPVQRPPRLPQAAAPLR